MKDDYDFEELEDADGVFKILFQNFQNVYDFSMENLVIDFDIDVEPLSKEKIDEAYKTNNYGSEFMESICQKIHEYKQTQKLDTIILDLLMPNIPPIWQGLDTLYAAWYLDVDTLSIEYSGPCDEFHSLFDQYQING